MTESPWSTLSSVSGLSFPARERRRERLAVMTCVTLTTGGLGRPVSLAGTRTLPMKGLGIEAASGHAEVVGELVGCLEYRVGNGDGRLHTVGIPRVTVR